MKKTVMLVTLCVLLHSASKAQCDKKIKWTASKSEFIDTASGDVAQTSNEPIIMTTDAKTVTIVLKGDHADSMTGEVKDYACSWQDKQNGKLSFKSELTDQEGETRHATITVEAVNGNTTALLQAEEESTKIRLTIDSFEEE